MRNDGDGSAAAFIAGQLQSLLSIVDLEVDGHAVDIDGFAFRDKPLRRFRPNHPVKIRRAYQDMRNMGRFDPGIQFVMLQLCSLLKIVELCARGAKVTPDGFRLKTVKNWEMFHERHNDPYFTVLQYLSWPCTTRCEFCLHKGDPPGYYTKSKFGWKTCREEIDSRINRWDPEHRKGVPPKSEYNYFEILHHPEFRDVSARVREKSGACINVVTNGNRLTPDVINHLEAIKPVFLGVSLNSFDADVRRKIMRDPDPQVALESLKRLKERAIPYFVSLVARDAGGVEDIVRTIRCVEEFDPCFVRINLEAHTKYSPERRSLSESDRTWKSIVRHISGRKKEFRVPVLFQPAMIEEKYLRAMRNRNIVDGVIRHSPAWHAGIRSMDELLSIDDVPFAFKSEARRFLSNYQGNGVREFAVGIRRGSSILRFSVRKNAMPAVYPYLGEKSPVVSPYGFFLQGGLDYEIPGRIISLAREYKAKNVLVLTSHIVKSSLGEMIEAFASPRKGAAKIHLEVPSNRAFLGGNIIVGDLLVVDDFIRCVKDWKKRKRLQPDLVIVPSTPWNEWGRDLTNRSWLEIERVTGLRVERIHSERIESIP